MLSRLLRYEWLAKAWRETPRARRTGTLGPAALVAAITVLHFSIDTHLMFWHDLLRRAYYIPIIWAVYVRGFRGGVLASVTVVAVFLVHLLTGWGHHLSAQSDQLYDLFGYVTAGFGGGILVDRARQGAVALALQNWEGSMHRLLSAATHDLKSPLVTVARLSHSLQTAHKLGEWEHSIGVRLNHAAGVLEAIRNDLAGSSRILSSREFEMDPLEWAPQCATHSQTMPPSGQTTIEVDAASSLPRSCPISTSALEEVIRCFLEETQSGPVGAVGNTLVRLSGSKREFVMEVISETGCSPQPGLRTLPKRGGRVRQELLALIRTRLNCRIETITQASGPVLRVTIRSAPETAMSYLGVARTP